MSNRKYTVKIIFFALLIQLAITACDGSNNNEQPVKEATPAIEESTEEIQIAGEDTNSTIEEAVEDVIKEVEEITTQESIADYDADLYGAIDDIDLNGVQVTFWTRYDDSKRKEAMDSICADFNANNEYGIVIECLPIGHYSIIYDNMIAGLNTGELPGLVVAYQEQAATYQSANGLVGIDPYMNHPVYGLREGEADDFFQLFIDSDRLPQFNNQVYGFPAAGRSMEMLFVNMDWLVELGYDAAPQTPEAFAEMACAATARPFSKNESGFSAGMELSTGASAFASWVFARGGDIYDLEAGKFTYNTPEAVEAMTMLQDLYANGCIAQISEQYGDQTDFGNGKTLFTTSSSSGLPFYADAVNDGEVGSFAWTVAPLPYTGNVPVQNIYGASVSIIRTDPQTQLASWLFLKFWSSPENQAKWTQASNYFPVRASAIAELSDYMSENTTFGTAFDLLQYSKAEAPVAGYDNIRNIVNETMIAIVFDGADVTESLAALETQANKIMAESAP